MVPIVLLTLLAAVLPGAVAAAQAVPAVDACVTAAAPDGAEPPCNPHLAQSAWATSHRGAYAQGSSPLPGPAGPAEQIDVFHDGVADAPIQIQFSSPYADGRRVAWASTVGVGSIVKYDPDANAFIDLYSPVLEGGELPTAPSVSGAYNMLDRDDRLIVGRRAALEVYGDAIPGERLSPIARLAQLALPDEALCTDEDVLVGLGMTADGRAAFVTERGVVGVVPRQPERMTAEALQVISLNGDACDDPDADPASLETISNSIATDEQGGIYVTTSVAQYRIDSVGGGAPRVAWRAVYPTEDGGGGVGGGGRLGVGSGSTPSLVGTGPDDDRLVAITDGRDLMHVILMWRDEIPAGWEPIAEGYDRRIACEFPVTFGDPGTTESLSEQSLLVRGNAVIVVDNYQQLDPLIGLFPSAAAPLAQLISGLPGNQPTGLERIDWNPQTRRCEQVWANPDVSLPNGIPTMSADSGLIYGIGSRDGIWTLEGIDLGTGEVRLTVPTTAFPTSNSFYAATQVGPDGSVWTGNFGGITRFETCDPLGGRECGRRIDPLEALIGPPSLDPGDLIGLDAGGPDPDAEPDDRPAPAVSRVGGGDRVATALALSAGTSSADAVVLATATAYADALTGAPLAAVAGGPLLLTDGEALDPRVLAEIRRLGAREVLLMGGTAALGPAVEAALREAGLDVERLAGADRFATAALAGAEVRARGGDPALTVVAEGADPDPARGWPDAVTAAGLAATLGAPVALTTTDELPASSAELLVADGEALLVGGTGALSPTVAEAVADRLGETTRVAGRDRYETSAAVALLAQQRGADPASTFVAAGTDWPDALASAAAAGGAGGVLLLVDGAAIDRSAASATLLVEQDRVIRELVLVGGTAAIGEATADRIARLVEVP